MPELEKTNTANGSPNDSPDLSQQQTAQSNFGRYGPLAQISTHGTRLEAFGGELQPGLWKPVHDRKFANPAPLGLCGFALTTFILGCIEMQTRDIALPNIIIGPAFAYGGLVQLCAGMWYVLSSSSGLVPNRMLTQWQGNGRGKYIRCYCPLFLWWILDFNRDYLHSWWIRDYVYLRETKWWFNWNVL